MHTVRRQFCGNLCLECVFLQLQHSYVTPLQRRLQEPHAGYSINYSNNNGMYTSPLQKFYLISNTYKAYKWK